MTISWFKHDLVSRDDDKCFEIIDIHGIGGYGFLWAILEELYKAEDSGFQIEATPVWIKRLAKDLNITDSRTITRYFDTFADLGLINKQMWQEHIIYSDGVMKRADVYMKEKARKAKNKQDERNRAKQNNLIVTGDNANVSSDKSVTMPMSHDVFRSDTDTDTDTNKEINTLVQKQDLFDKSNDSAKPDFFEADFEEISGNQNQSIPNPLTQIINQEPVRALALVKSQPKNGFTPEQFDEYWAAVGMKVDKQSAKEQFFKIRNVDFDVLLRALWDQQDFYSKKEGDLQHLSRPKTWLKNRRWEDVYPNMDKAQVKAAVQGNEILNLIKNNQRRNENVGQKNAQRLG